MQNDLLLMGKKNCSHSNFIHYLLMLYGLSTTMNPKFAINMKEQKSYAQQQQQQQQQ